MLFGAGVVTMVRKDSGKVKRQCRGRTQRYLLGDGVEDGGREMGRATIAGKKVGREEEPAMLAIETHVPTSVPRKMDGSQTMPDINEVAVVEPAVRYERTKAKKRPANALQTTRDPRPTGIDRMPGVVVGIETRGGNPGAGLAGDPGHVENMIQMSVRDDNSANWLALPSAAAKRPPQKEASANESRIEQIQARCVLQHVKIERGRPNLEYISKQRRKVSSPDSQGPVPPEQSGSD